MNVAGIVNSMSILFPKKISITLVHRITLQTIGSYNSEVQQLPEIFNKPIVITYQGIEWQVMKATPSEAKNFTQTRKLILYVQEVTSLQPGDMKYAVPTRSSDLPAITDNPLFDDFIMPINRNQWHQLELLPSSILSEIQEEMLQVQHRILEDKFVDNLLGYETIHTRRNIGKNSLCFELDKFAQFVDIQQKGALFFESDGLIADGYAVRSDNYLYYGCIKNNVITSICLYSFDCVDEEFYQIASSNDLALADWCNGKIIMT